jgi:hypothetical protein
MEHLSQTRSTRSITQLSEKIFLYTTKCEEPMSILYEIECARFSTLIFTFNFEQTANMKIEDACGEFDDSNKSLKTEVAPFERMCICKLVMADPTQRAILSTSYSWEVRSLNKKKYVLSHDNTTVRFPIY